MRKCRARDVALDVLIRVEKHQSYSNLELNRILRRSALTSLDRQLVTTLVYGTLQRRNTIDWILSPFVSKKLRNLDMWVRELLRMSVYQLTYLDKVPTRAAIHEAVEIAKRRGHRGVASFVNAVLRNVQRQGDRLHFTHHMDEVRRLSLEHSHPEWLIKRWLEAWDAETVASICQANNEPPSHTLRVNPMKISRQDLKAKLERDYPEAHIRYSDIAAQGLITQGLGNIGNSTWHENGWCSIQDESSMLVGDVLNPTPGASVIDLCAAPGGKATHLAELMHGRGTVHAFDIHEHKIHLIEAHAKRLGLHNITAKRTDARDLPRRLSKRFDYVLLDAPCSGLGVIRRKPEIKWRQSAQDIASLAELQRQLLVAAAQLVKPGGVFVYSTCTLEPQENEQQIAWFLERYPAFKLDAGLADELPKPVVEKNLIGTGQLRIFPQDFHSDGFFIARLQREGSTVL